MNKTAIKNFAIWARVNLIEAAKQRAYEYEITDGGQNNPNAEIIAGRPLSRNEQNQRKQLIEQIRIKGFDQVMEEAAYTWFNRFIALRYMEVNGYLPTRIRVFTNDEGEFKPEILKEAMTVELEGLDREKVLDLLDKQDIEALYKMLLIAQCNSLSTGLPYMFERIANWTELLFPANLLKSDSILGQLISSIPEEDWVDAIEIIGWMYQFYNTELNDMVYDGNMSKARLSKELLPAATTIYTPDWPIRYMVENSLGRIYIQRKLVNSGDWLVADELAKASMEKQEAENMGWKYYLPEAEQDPAVRDQLIAISNSYSSMRVEDIKVIDPCMGSGHILVYAFDVLMQIYSATGWSERDAAKSIINNNLYGLDIDDRAGQLAYFAVMMKARKYNRRILNGDIRPNVMAIQDSSFITEELINYVAAGDNSIHSALTEIKKIFTDAKEYGSILNVKPLNFEDIYQRIETIELSTPEDLFAMQYRNAVLYQLKPLVNQASIMACKYTVVVTNPPYLSNARYSPLLDTYIKEYYSEVKSDLSAVMYRHVLEQMSSKNGMVAFITTSSWMFLSSFEKMREYILLNCDFESVVDFGTELFDGKVGHNPIVAWVVRNGRIGKRMTGVRLVDFCYSRRDEKEPEFFNEDNHFYPEQDNFRKLPGIPIAYWVSKGFIRAFDNPTLNEVAKPRQGLATGENNRFTRLWFELIPSRICFDAESRTAAEKTGKKWFPYNKGGEFRKWYGNNDYVVNWENDGFEIRNFKDDKGKLRSRPQNMESYFQPSITWSKISSGNIAFRYKPQGHIFDVAGTSIFTETSIRNYIHGFCNSCVALKIAQILSPTLNYEVGHVASFPIVIDQEHKAEIDCLVENNIALSREDWDAYEVSWDFKQHPLVRNTKKLSEAYSLWEAECETRFNAVRRNETRLNELFIDIYGLGDELDAKVSDKDITIRVANVKREVKSLISYAVGCMFGRYSLDCLGLAYAGGEWNAELYNSFVPDSDGIIPICDDEYFNDDIVNRFIHFIDVVYGSEYLEDNLNFIAKSLGGTGTSREVIRSYFVNEFYSDHCSIYSGNVGRRPIYWLFDSGKKNGFKALISMHRYQPDTIARIRTDYIHELQSRYRTAIADLEDRVEHAAASERVKLSKQLAKIKDQELELRKYEEKIHHLADQMIEIDLDDGVKVNYAKFGDVLAKIK